MRRSLLALTVATLLLGATAPSAIAAGERSYRGSCHDGKLQASVILRTHRLYSRKTHKSYRTIYRIVYRLRGMDPRKRRSLVMFHSNIFTYVGSNKLAPTPMNGYPAPFAQYLDSIISDGRGHTLDSRKWQLQQSLLYWGTYTTPIDDKLRLNYGYIFNFAFGNDLGRPSCGISMPKRF